MTEDTPAARLEYLRGEIQAERISYSEISELQALAAHIEPGDVELLQWAGVPEDGLTAEWRRVPLAPCPRCQKLMPAGQTFCNACSTEDGPVIKGGAPESTNGGVPAPFKHLAARQALETYGAGYAGYIERHIDELLTKGIDVRHQSLGERLAGNDGD